MTSSRRNFIQKSMFTAAGISVAQQSLLAKIFMDELPYTMKPLRNNVGFFTERGGTIGWMISKNGIVVVDTQFPEQSKHLIDAIKKQSDRKIDLLINTHHHGDHSSGNIAFKGIVEIILAHENSKKNQMRVAKERGNEAGQLYPDTTFSKEWSNQVGEETITLKYFGPAHTDGDAIIHFENANIVHMGDLIFNRRFPFIDKSAGASIKNWIQVLESAQKTYDTDTIFIFGHSGEGYDIVGNMDDIKAKQNFLSRLLEIVNSEIQAGKSQEAILKIKSIKGAEEWSGNGIGRCLSIAYQELNSE
ncbi:MAG: MBL fold metallo-hydrolase [Cyclobacteriaceae bacterium]|nr:MBL fold metallo-hydrolase [Cyclobacteriaceae bacterium]